MAGRALAVVHQPDADPGVFAEAAAAQGWELVAWPIAEDPDPPEDPLSFHAVLSFGGSANVDQDAHYPWLTIEKALLSSLLTARVPVLGVCLGAQLLAEAAGAPAQRAREPEIGWSAVELTAAGAEDPLMAALAPGFLALQWHSYEFPLPPGAVALARSPACLQAYRIGDQAWGLQFHAEVSGENLERWIDELGHNPDALAQGVDPSALRSQSQARLEAWNALGRDLAARFLDRALALSRGLRAAG